MHYDERSASIQVEQNVHVNATNLSFVTDSEAPGSLGNWAQSTVGTTEIALRFSRHRAIEYHRLLPFSGAGTRPNRFRRFEYNFLRQLSREVEGSNRTGTKELD